MRIDQEFNFDIIIAGEGPSGIAYLKSLEELTLQPKKFLKAFGAYLPSHLADTILNNSLDLRICLIRGGQPRNQFVAGWDTPYDELKPFGLHVKDFARHYSKILEWEFPTTKIRYNSPYCSIDHLKVLRDILQNNRSQITIREAQLKDVKFSIDKVTTICDDGSALNSKLFIDAMGYQSIPNQKFNLNKHSPIYQMILWKNPVIHGYDINVNNIWYKPAKLYKNPKFDLNDRVSGWFHPVSDGVIIGASKYQYSPMGSSDLSKLLTPYLEEYVKIRQLIPEGEREVYQGIGVLYNPDHRLKIPRLLQIGDARRLSRPATGYGFIPGFWSGMFAAVATSIAFKNKDFTHRSLDDISIKLFNSNFKLNYTFGYLVQNLFLSGDWKTIEFLFTLLKKIMPVLYPGFFDRLTMAQFTPQDGLRALPYLLGNFALSPNILLNVSRKLKFETLKYLADFSKYLLSFQSYERFNLKMPTKVNTK